MSYDGSDFHGWQVQPGLPTVQGTIEDAVSTIEGERACVEASGRTDAGVHAIGQVAAVTLQNPIPPDNFRRAVNRLLPFTIRISHVCEVPLQFHPRYDARSKIYEYRIFREEVCPPFLRRYVTHHPYPLNEAAMMNAAAVLKGEHDFTAFAASDATDERGRSKVRTIYSSQVERAGDLLVYRVCGSGFLKHMVRNIMGVTLEVGKGNLSAADVEARLKPECGIPAGPSAPASGLFLMSVNYGEDDEPVS